MNVRMDEFIVVTRAFLALQKSITNDVRPLDFSGIEHCMGEMKNMIPTLDDDSIFPINTRCNIVRNLKFLLEGAVTGLEFNSYVICKNKFMFNIFVATFPYTRKDNSEVIDVKLAFYIQDTHVLIASPFKCPGLTSKFGGFNDYVFCILETSWLDIDHSNKSAILDILDREVTNNGGRFGENLLELMDTMATDIHMQCEYFLKAHSHVQDNEYKVITEEDAEFQHLYSKYGDKMNSTIDDDILEATDFMPVIVTDNDVTKTMCAQHTYNGKLARLESRIIGCETYEDLTTSDTPSSTREVLVRCPNDESKPFIIKLPFNLIYIDYNVVMNISDDTTFPLLDKECSMAPSNYVPGAIEDVGIESDKGSTAKELFITLKQFGISKSSKMYEFLYPIIKLPSDLMKSALITVKSVFLTSNQIEKEESEIVKDKMLNDELDSTLDQLDTVMKTYVLAITTCMVLGNIFLGLLIWLITKSKVKKNKIKGLERTERRLVSKIRECETKLNYANQESDYKAVKSYTHRMDTYKMMLDKLREVKKESLGKEEKYTDTYKEYGD